MKAEPKKTMLICCDFPPRSGGEARFAFDLVEAIRLNDFYCLVPENAAVSENERSGPVTILRKWFPTDLHGAMRFFRPFFVTGHVLAEARKRGIVRFVAFQPLAAGTAAMVAAWLFEGEFSVFVHGGDLLEYRKKLWSALLVRLILKRARRIIANSSSTQSLIGEVSKRLAKKVRILHPPAREIADLQAPKGETIRPRAGRFVGSKILLTVGRLIRQKGHHLVLSILRKLVDKDSSYRYVIIGDGPEKVQLTRIVADLGLGSHVDILGYLSEAETNYYFDQADLFVLLSYRDDDVGWVEGFGIVLLEAAIHGLPVVASRAGGCVDALADGMNGFLVDPGDPLECQQKIERIFAEPDLACSFSVYGREWAKTRFSPERTARRFERLIDG